MPEPARIAPADREPDRSQGGCLEREDALGDSRLIPPVRVIMPAEPWNIKFTTAGDWQIAEALERTGPPA